MLDRQIKSLPPRPIAEPQETVIGLPHLISFFRRRKMTIGLTMLAVLALGIAYIVTKTPLYTATTSLLIDTRRLALFSEGNVVGDTVVSNSAVETQAQILQSSKIAEAVARKLNLIHDADFMNVNPGLVAKVINPVVRFVAGLINPPPPPGPPPDDNALNTVAGLILLQNLQVSRVGLSFVIEIDYADKDPMRAARIANALTAAYVEDQFNAQVQTTQQGTDWLLSRLQHLRDQAATADLSAQEKSAVRTTYDTFLQRYTQAVQQQSLPYTEARVITQAIPGTKTSPKILLVLAASIVFGGALGLALAIARELLDQAVRTRRQVESVTGGTFLGYLPGFNLGGLTTRRGARRARKMLDPAARRFETEPAHSMALTAPFSRYTETLRAIKVAADRSCSGHGCVLGVISSMPNEGKSTVAINLARLVAQSDGKALLIDGDLRSQGLSKSIVPPGTPGLVQLVQGQAKLSEVLWLDQSSRLQFLPTGSDEKLSEANEILSSAGMQALLEACRRQYGLVIVDLPAVLPVVDVRAAAHMFDGFVFVVDWGRTSEEVLAQAFHLDGIEDKALGVVLNKVNMPTLKRYQDRTIELAKNQYLDTYRHIA